MHSCVHRLRLGLQVSASRSEPWLPAALAMSSAEAAAAYPLTIPLDLDLPELDSPSDAAQRSLWPQRHGAAAPARAALVWPWQARAGAQRADSVPWHAPPAVHADAGLAELIDPAKKVQKEQVAAAGFAGGAGMCEAPLLGLSRSSLEALLGVRTHRRAVTPKELQPC